MENQELEKANPDLLKAVRQTALVFFIIIGGGHLLSGLMSSQNQFLPISNIVNKVLDIPFAVISTLFGLSNFRINSQSNHKKTALIAMGIILLLVLLIMIYITALVPDKPVN